MVEGRTGVPGEVGSRRTGLRSVGKLEGEEERADQQEALCVGTEGHWQNCIWKLCSTFRLSTVAYN